MGFANSLKQENLLENRWVASIDHNEVNHPNSALSCKAGDQFVVHKIEGEWAFVTGSLMQQQQSDQQQQNDDDDSLAHQNSSSSAPQISGWIAKSLLRPLVDGRRKL